MLKKLLECNIIGDHLIPPPGLIEFKKIPPENSHRGSRAAFFKLDQTAHDGLVLKADFFIRMDGLENM